MGNVDSLFERRLSYPDSSARKRFDGLLGIDNVKTTILKSISTFLNPEDLRKWGEKHHKGASKLMDRVLSRPPLLVFAGDVGTGKTELAESVGDPVARRLGIGITLFPLSLSARGTGRVGEMTKLISSAFEYTLKEAEKFKSKNGGPPRAGVILLVDEADALAQSREMEQMHHEDKAGVNAFIRGIDHITHAHVPAVVIMCTNRLSSIDPAVRRRVAEIAEFRRPGKEQIQSVLSVFSEAGFSGKQISKLTDMAMSKNENGPGFSYSDLTQRLLPKVVLNAYPDKPVRFEDVAKTIAGTNPTPGFRDEMNDPAIESIK